MCAVKSLSGVVILLTMGLFQVVLAAVTNIEDVCNLQHVNDLLILRMVPITEPQTPWQDFIWISLG